MNLGAALTRAAGHFKGRCAVVCGSQERTFTEVDENANRLANGLLKLGVRKQDRVAIFCENCVEYVETDWALYKSGMVRVAINPLLSPAEVAYIIKDSGANTVVVTPRLAKLVSQAKSQLPEVKHYLCISPPEEGMVEYSRFIAAQKADPPEIEVNEEDLSMLFYTGGTTGVPKGAMHTHESIFQVLMNLQAEFWHLNQSDIFLSGGSLAHANGFRAMTSFLEGAKFIIPEQFVPAEIFRTVEREKVTLLSTVPTTLIRLCNYPDIKKFNLSSLRLITYGAAPMPTEKLKEALSIFGKRLGQSFGQAESLMAISHLSIEDHVPDGAEREVRKLASAGRPYIANAVRIVDQEGRDVKIGDVGEVIVKSKINMKGYWRNQKATLEALKDGWVYTGDLGTLDEDGYIYLIDRKKDMIISGGYNIYAREVEDILHTHPAIAEAAVIGVPDDEWGESVKAVVALKAGMTLSEEGVIQYCKERLASYKKPKSVDFLPELPKTSIGKISKKDLKAPYWANQKRAIH